MALVVINFMIRLTLMIPGIIPMQVKISNMYFFFLIDILFVYSIVDDNANLLKIYIDYG